MNSDLVEHVAIHEAGHAVMAYRQGYKIRYGLTADRLTASCWLNALRYYAGGCPAQAKDLPCIVATCNRWPHVNKMCKATRWDAEAPGFYAGMLPEIRHLQAIPNQEDRRRAVERWICVAHGGGCAVSAFDPALERGDSEDLRLALEAAQLVYPEDGSAAEVLVAELYTKTYAQISEPRNQALIIAIMDALRAAPQHTLPCDRLKAVIDATVASESN